MNLVHAMDISKEYLETYCMETLLGFNRVLLSAERYSLEFFIWIAVDGYKKAEAFSVSNNVHWFPQFSWRRKQPQSHWTSTRFGRIQFTYCGHTPPLSTRFKMRATTSVYRGPLIEEETAGRIFLLSNFRQMCSSQNNNERMDQSRERRLADGELQPKCSPLDIVITKAKLYWIMRIWTIGTYGKLIRLAFEELIKKYVNVIDL